MTLSRSKTLIAAIAVLSFLGFLDASYLALEHYLGAVPACSILEGCEIVTTSSYATLEGTIAAIRGGEPVFLIPRGISVALAGAAYYGVFFLAAVLSWRANGRFLLQLAPFSGLGVLAAAWFLSLQAFVLDAFCVYCIASAAVSTLLFLTALGLIQWKRSRIGAAING
ncbi:MAG: vitamin K epoxide reductase family protein [Candidatus Niyogibacteria bacterium]|nr:vitamin K epoxide reductase family protein [Candidatus Niyogibacteria bacterium]